MRNVFRTLKLPVVIGSTDGIAREMITASDGCSPGENGVRWCVVVPEMSRFQDPAVETLPRDDLARLVRHSRPLFARFAMEYVNDHELPSQDDPEQTVRFMDGLTQDLAAKCRQTQRPGSELLRRGQLSIFRSFAFYDSTQYSTGLTGGLIHGHFARLEDAEMFELRFRTGSELHKLDFEPSRHGSLAGKKPRDPKPRVVFPRIDQDVLLYLSLLGGKHHRAFLNGRGEFVSYCAALEGYERSRPPAFDFSNPLQPSKVVRHLESMMIAGIVSASHCSGLAGIPLHAFFCEMVFELGMGCPMAEEDWHRVIPALLRFLTVPFLAPPDAQWPAWLPSALNLGTLTLARSITDPYDLQIDDGWLTGECEGRCNVLRLNRMKSILKCIQPHCVVHVVFTTQLQASYFRWESFEKYLVTKCPHLMKTLFLRCETEGRVRSISGMERPVASPDRLVLFLAQRPPVVRRQPKIFTTAASVPEAVGVGEVVNADTTMEGSEEARDDEAQEARSQTDQPVKKRRIN